MARQTEVPGTERKVVKEVSSAGEFYRQKRDARMAASVEEKEAKVALLEVMKKHKLDLYQDDNAVPPFVVIVSHGQDDVKVKNLKPAGAVDHSSEVN